jgi:hypothetical protein
MEPRFHTGDLAILRPTGTYQIGEIVGYKSPQFGIVLHRIIGEVNGHFLMKGDNNNFVDTYHPRPGDIVGRLWLHVPKIGSLISSKKDREIGVTMMAVAMAGGIVAPAERDRRRRRRTLRRSDDVGVGATSGSPSQTRDGGAHGILGTTGQIIASIVAIFALGALTLGAFAYTRATSVKTSNFLPYQQTGVWSYDAPARGSVYVNNVATTGQPLYSALAPLVQIKFGYRLTSALPTTLHGDAGFSAVLSSSDGWSHPLTMGTTTPFTGTSVQISDTLNLLDIRNFIASVATQTGQGAGSSLTYSLTIEPDIHSVGSMAGKAFRPPDFSPPLSFSIFGNEAQLNLGVGGSSQTLTQLTHPSVNGAFSVTQDAVAHLSLLGLRLSVTTARRIALLVLLVCLLAFAVLLALLRRAYLAPETQRIAARFGSLLVSVRRPDDMELMGNAITMDSIEDLAKIAIHQGRMILYCPGEMGRLYFVRDQTSTYLYCAPDASLIEDAVTNANSSARSRVVPSAMETSSLEIEGN